MRQMRRKSSGRSGGWKPFGHGPLNAFLVVTRSFRSCLRQRLRNCLHEAKMSHEMRTPLNAVIMLFVHMAASLLFDSRQIGQFFTPAFCPFCLHFAARFAWSWVAILPTPARSFCQIRGGHFAPSGAAILPRCRGGRSFLFPIVANKRDSAISVRTLKLV